MQQQLKDITADFVNLVSQAPDGALDEFLSIVEKMERSDTTDKMVEFLKNEIESRKATKLVNQLINNQ